MIPAYVSTQVETSQVAGSSFASQVQVFHDATIVVMAHGAIFSNAPFLPRGAAAVEVMSHGRALRSARPWKVCMHTFHENCRDGLLRDSNVTAVEFGVDSEGSTLRWGVTSQERARATADLTQPRSANTASTARMPDAGRLGARPLPPPALQGRVAAQGR